MPDRLVVHCKREPFDQYIGRPAKPVPFHYGNPFSNRGGTKAAEVVDDPVTEFRHWLHGIAHTELEQDRRRWIIRNLPSLAGKVLGCWCVTPEWPDAECHGWVLTEFARRLEGCTPDEAWDLVDGWRHDPKRRAASDAAVEAALQAAYTPPAVDLAPARATDRTDVKGTSWLERDGKRVPIVVTLGSDLAESRRLAAALDRLRNP